MKSIEARLQSLERANYWLLRGWAATVVITLSVCAAGAAFQKPNDNIQQVIKAERFVLMKEGRAVGEWGELEADKLNGTKFANSLKKGGHFYGLMSRDAKDRVNTLLGSDGETAIVGGIYWRQGGGSQCFKMLANADVAIVDWGAADVTGQDGAGWQGNLTGLTRYSVFGNVDYSLPPAPNPPKR